MNKRERKAAEANARDAQEAYTGKKKINYDNTPHTYAVQKRITPVWAKKPAPWLEGMWFDIRTECADYYIAFRFMTTVWTTGVNEADFRIVETTK